MGDIGPTPKHTPTPWRVMQANGENAIFDNGAPMLIARVGKSHRGDDRDNAQFIVESCNNIERITAERDELLAACKFALNQLHLLAPPGSRERTWAWPAMSDCETAIANAEKARVK